MSGWLDYFASLAMIFGLALLLNPFFMDEAASWTELAYCGGIFVFLAGTFIAVRFYSPWRRSPFVARFTEWSVIAVVVYVLAVLANTLLNLTWWKFALLCAAVLASFLALYVHLIVITMRDLKKTAEERRAERAAANLSAEQAAATLRAERAAAARKDR